MQINLKNNIQKTRSCQLSWLNICGPDTFSIFEESSSPGFLERSIIRKLEWNLWLLDQIFWNKNQLVAFKLFLQTTYKKPEVASYYG